MKKKRTRFEVALGAATAADVVRLIESEPRALGGSRAMPPWEGVFTEEQPRNRVDCVHSSSGRSRGSGARSSS